MEKPEPHDPLDQVFAYRAFDLRNRFPDPLPTFKAALECLQSDDAYLPEMDAEIVAYLKDGRTIRLPDCFYWAKQMRFSSREEAKSWVEKRQAKIEQGVPLARLEGTVVADPLDPIEKQIQDAMESTITHVIDPEYNPTVTRQAADWLRAAIRALPSVDQGA